MKYLRTLISRTWLAEKSRTVGFTLLIAFSLLLNFTDPPALNSVRLALFDQYQTLSPRKPQSQPVIIVAIDETTLAALGQWPWPRHYVAALIDAIAALKPAAVGLDIIMPEADRTSPQSIAESRPDLPVEVRHALTAALSNDHQLATSLAGTPSILGAAGFKFKTSSTLEGLRINTLEVHGNDPLPQLTAYPYVLASLPEFQAAAQGQALLSNEPENGIVRRMAMLSNLNGTLTPELTLEMLRVAHGVPHLVVHAGMHGIESVEAGSRRIPLQSNGEAWVHFSPFSEQRFISALSVLKGEVTPERIKGKMVLIGLTGLGLQDFIATPLGDQRHGVEIHAQLIESFEEGHFLTRPGWMPWLELSVLIGSGLLLIKFTPNTRLHPVNTGITPPGTIQERRSQDRSNGIQPKFAAMIAALLFVLLFGTGIALFCGFGLLFDAATLFLALISIFASLLIIIFIESGIQRDNAERALQNQRLQAAQLAGELDAARRIQLGTLPVAASAFPGETRFEIAAMLESARQVGGDLYDFFMIDAQRLFFVIGDVSGKGLPASLFMVVTKALAKSAALRGNENIGTIITQTNLEMARENPQMLFVTGVAGILNVESGTLELVNAGHDAPWHIGADRSIERINGNGGPPLCVLENFSYPTQCLQLSKGDSILLLTDGIAEAMNSNGEQYGIKRVSEVLINNMPHPHPSALIAMLRDDVRCFVGNTEASDDLTLLILCWQGSADS